MNRRHLPRLVRALGVTAVLSVGLVLATGGTASAAGPLPSFAICSGSSLCESGNLPLLEEAGIVSSGAAVAGASTATIAVASGGVAALGTFNTAIGIVGAATAVTAGAAVAAGILTSQGLPSGVKLKTSPDVSPGSGGGTYALTGDIPLPAGGHMHFLGPFPTYDVGQVACVVFDSGTYHSGDGVVNFSDSSTVSDPGSFGGICPSGSSYGFWNDHAGATALSFTTPTYGSEPSHTYTFSGSAPAAGWHGIIRTTVTCTGPDGDFPQTASQPVDVDAGGDLNIPTVQCPAGDLATAVAIEFAPTATPDTWLPLTSGATPGSVKSLVTTYPDCFGPGVDPCKLQLQQKTGSAWTTCGPAATYCPDWVAQSQQDPDLYRCVYGTYELTIDHCSAYRRPGSVLPNYNSDTNTVTPITAPVPSDLPNQLQTPAGDGAPLPNGDSSTDPQDCWPTGWGVFNPLAWVYDPIVCAAKALFTPNPAEIETDTEQIRQAWEGTPPGLIIAAVAGWTIVPPASGCNGITFDTSWLFMGIGGGSHSMTIMQACPGDMLAPIATWSRVFMDLAFIVGAVLAITRYIAGIVAFGGLGKDE